MRAESVRRHFPGSQEGTAHRLSYESYDDDDDDGDDDDDETDCGL